MRWSQKRREWRISTQKEAHELHTSRKKWNWQETGVKSKCASLWGAWRQIVGQVELRKLGLNARRLGTLTDFFNLMTVWFKKGYWSDLIWIFWRLFKSRKVKSKSYSGLQGPIWFGQLFALWTHSLFVPSSLTFCYSSLLTKPNTWQPDTPFRAPVCGLTSTWEVLPKTPPGSLPHLLDLPSVYHLGKVKWCSHHGR